MPERTKATGNYRYGFNGKENDQDMSSDGLPQDYGMRIYEPRLGRFLSIDPLTKQYPELTPYQFASNTPIQATDFDGEEAKYVDIYTTQATYYGKNLILNNTRHEDISRQAGWHWGGRIIPSYKKEGSLGGGTLYTIYKTNLNIYYDQDQKKTITSKTTTKIGYIYTPPPPTVDKDHPASSLSFGLQIWGSGYDPSEAPTSKANEDARIVTFNYKEIQEVMEPILLGFDVKNPMKPEIPKLDNLVFAVGGETLENAIKQIDKKWEKNNEITYCRTCLKNFLRKDGEVTRDTTSKPATDTIDTH